jgi:hypothetical protein
MTRFLPACTRLCSFLLAAALTGGCSEEPTRENAVGGNLGQAGYVVRETTVVATSSSVYRTSVPMNGPVNLVGRFQGYTAYTPIRFAPSLFPVRDTILVLSATLRLRAVSVFGDSGAAFGVQVHRIAKLWSDTVKWADVQTGFYDPAPLSTQFFPVGADTEQVFIRLDTALVRSWFKKGSTTFPDSAKQGVMLLPAPGTGLVRGFNSFLYSLDSAVHYPTLEVIAINVAGTVRDTTRYTTGSDTFTGNLEMLTPAPDMLTTQSGIVERSRLRFDVGFIPRGSVINQAEITLIEQRSAGHLSTSAVRGVNMHLAIPTPGDSNSFAVLAVPSRIPDFEPETYLFNVTAQVQRWVRGPNDGLVLRARDVSEYGSFDRFVFFGPAHADTSNRPRLKLLYTTERPPGDS